MNFSGYLDLQEQHLLDLGVGSKLTSGDAATAVDNISNKLNQAKTAYNEANLTSRSILTHQDDVTKLVLDEKTRLEEKKKSIDDALESQKRMIQLNESYRQRYRMYLKIVITILIVTVLFILIKVFSGRLLFVPGPVWDLILIAIFSIAGFYVYFTIIDMRRRDQMNFNKLFFTPPAPEDAKDQPSFTEVQKDGKETLYDFITGANAPCIGGGGNGLPDCCSAAGLTWSTDLNQCVSANSGQ
jgi:hypothetical protein